MCAHEAFARRLCICIRHLSNYSKLVYLFYFSVTSLIHPKRRREVERGLLPRIYVINYVDQQTLNPDDDYVLPHERLWTFDVLVCPLSVTERFLLQPLVCGTVFHHPPSLSILCCRLKSHLFSLSYPDFWLFSHLYNARAVTRHFRHYNRCYI